MKQLQLKKILIPTDFSKTGLLAVEHAAFMARICKANLYLLHAIEISETTFGIYDPAIVVPDFSEVDKIAAVQLNELAANLRKQYGIVIKTICTRGKAAYEIVNAVKEHKIDIVVMGTHGAHGFNEYFVGSNAHKTVTICPCPVITVQTSAKKLGFTDIVLPIDDNFDSRQKVDATISLAKKYASKIHVLGLQEKGEGPSEKTFKIKLDSVEKAIQKSGLAYDIKTVKGDNLALAALKYSRKVKADLIVVLTGLESQLTVMFLGTFAKQIVNHSKIPIMSIRPSDLGLYDSVSLAGSNSI
jgi:nucleotide-binding universal stress UspA family protein